MAATRKSTFIPRLLISAPGKVIIYPSFRMAKIKLTKTELKAQTDALKRFQRFLPMLQLKKQQLQAEIAGIVARAEDVAAREDAARAALNGWVRLFSTGGELLEGLVAVKEVRTSKANVAGVDIDVYEGIDTEVGEVDLWSTPAWVDDAIDSIVSMLALKSERQVLQRQRELITAELVTTSQRVNLFEKVKIPACRENIRVIKIALGDEQTAAVTRGKIAKARAPESADGEEGGNAA